MDVEEVVGKALQAPTVEDFFPALDDRSGVAAQHPLGRWRLTRSETDQIVVASRWSLARSRRRPRGGPGDEQ